MKPETVTFRTEKIVPVADADGVAIHEGSVLRETNDGERGVVMRIVRQSDKFFTAFDCIGDVHIATGHGSRRVTNRYDQWQHIPHDEQTYAERLSSWIKRPYDHDEFKQCSEDEGKAIDGILALLPENTVDYDNGPFPDRIEDALQYLAKHLGDLAKQ